MFHFLLWSATFCYFIRPIRDIENHEMRGARGACAIGLSCTIANVRLKKKNSDSMREMKCIFCNLNEATVHCLCLKFHQHFFYIRYRILTNKVLKVSRLFDTVVFFLLCKIYTFMECFSYLFLTLFHNA